MLIIARTTGVHRQQERENRKVLSRCLVPDGGTRNRTHVLLLPFRRTWLCTCKPKLWR